MSLPGSLLPWLNRQFTDANGDPLANGYLVPLVTGTSTPKALYADANLSTPLSLPHVDLDGDGRVTAFLGSGGYDIGIYDQNANLLATVIGVEDLALTFLGSIGTQFSGGSKNVTTGYMVLATDYLVTVDSSGGATTINLPTAATFTNVLFIQNTSSHTVAITPNGSETINGAAAAFTLPAASGTTRPTAQLLSDHVSAWYVVSGAFLS